MFSIAKCLDSSKAAETKISQSAVSIGCRELGHVARQLSLLKTFPAAAAVEINERSEQSLDFLTLLWPVVKLIIKIHF